MTGSTASPDFPTVRALQPTFGGVAGFFDAFVAKLKPDGSALVYATYLGGNNEDEADSIVVDSTGAAYITGFTASPDFPTAHPLKPELNDIDGFVVKLTPEGSSLVYGTYLGGTDSDFGLGIALDVTGAVYVTGKTRSRDFPVKNAVQPARGGFALEDVFVTKLTPSGSTLVYSTFLGGGGRQWRGHCRGREGWCLCRR